MRNLNLIILVLFPLSLVAQDIFPSSHYHLESIDCPKGMICESRTDSRRKLLFFQIFDTEGRLHSEYLRTSDSTFKYKSFHLMDHFTLIKRPSNYGQKNGGTLLISNTQIGTEKEAYDYDTYEAYQYHDTLLMPISHWGSIDSKHHIEEMLKFNMQGEKQGKWDSYKESRKTIERVYQKDSLLSIHYVDEMTKEAEAREIMKRIQGTWNVYAKWENKHGTQLAIGQRNRMTKNNYARYTIEGNVLKIQEFKNRQKEGKKEKYKLSITDKKYLTLKNKSQTSTLKVLYLSDDDFRLLPKD